MTFFLNSPLNLVIRHFWSRILDLVLPPKWIVFLQNFRNFGLNFKDIFPQGTRACGWRVWRTRGSRCWYCIFFPWPIDQYTAPPSGALMLTAGGRAQITLVWPNQKARWSGRVSPLGIKPRLCSYLGSGRRPPWYKTRAVVTLRQWVETPWYKTRVVVTSGCRWSIFFCHSWLRRVQRCHCALLLPTDSFRSRKDELGMLLQSCHTGSLGVVLCPGFIWTDLFSVHVHI